MKFHEALQHVKTGKAKWMYRNASTAKYGYDESRKVFLHVDKTSEKVTKEISNLRTYISDRYRQANEWSVELKNGKQAS